jgi:ferric-dicitrate binding protein FerR (iron transport regulator)
MQLLPRFEDAEYELGDPATPSPPFMAAVAYQPGPTWEREAHRQRVLLVGVLLGMGLVMWWATSLEVVVG